MDNLQEASAALEATLIKQLIEASGAFKKSSMAGSDVRSGMFIEVLADAVAAGGGLGLGSMLQATLDPEKKAERDGALGLSQLDLPPISPMPPKAPGVTSGFGTRVHPVDGHLHFHTGVDLRATHGSEIRAAADGVVARAGNRGGYGLAVEVDHGAGVTTLYAHASALDVQPGEKIQKGQVLGRIGASGNATGPHLHFEVRREGMPIDPRKALNAYGIRAEQSVEEHR